MSLQGGGHTRSSYVNNYALQVRALRREDIPALLPVHREAFEGTLGVALGQRYLTAFLQWFIDYPESVCLVCELDGQPAGYVFGAPVGYGTRLNRDLLMEIMLAIATHPWVLLHSTFLSKIGPRARSLLGQSPATSTEDTAQSPTEIKAFSLVGIGVGASFRRRGVASTVISAFEQAVAERGFSELRLTVYRANEAACRFYDAAGWFMQQDDGNVFTYTRRLESTTG